MLQLAANEGSLAPNYQRVRVADSERRDVWDFANNLRDLDRLEIAAQGLGPLMVLRRSFNASLWCRSYFVDGEIAAMVGLGGVALGNVGEPWLLTSPAVERVPVTFVREAKKTVAEMLDERPILINHVLASYRGACRLLEILGFKLDPPEPYGRSGVHFRRFFMSR